MQVLDDAIYFMENPFPTAHVESRGNWQRYFKFLIRIAREADRSKPPCDRHVLLA
ncbi:MAG TPA: hypothetical protein VKE30_02915 [Chthoniobacterales bacterium]|nr:hypothetical protein [Chthoniobacterales bacterium]